MLFKIWKSTTVEPLRRALLGPRLCCVVSCPIGWVFHGVPVWWFGNGREKVKCIDEWESVWVYLWRNGFSSVWTHILFCFSFWRSQSTLNLKNFYSSMSVCPLFLNSEAHGHTINEKKQRRKVLDHVTSERTRSTFIFIINIQIKPTQTCTVQIILHNMISLRLKGIIVIINFMFFWKGTNNGVGSA